MAASIDNPPAAIQADLAVLRASLDASPIPPKVLDRNLLVATWNIRHLAAVTEKWASDPGDSPKRNLRDVLCLAEIVSRFDVIAIQEVRRELGGLRYLLQALGSDWAWILTDLTRGAAGDQERMAFLFDLRRVRPSGLAAELVVPLEDNTTLTETTLKTQFARTPYAVSFESRGVTFTLVTLHVIWGDGSADRLPEIKQIATWLADWAGGGDEFGANLMVLGDFNIDRSGDPLYQAFISTGLQPPAELASLPRTIFDDPTKPHFYDQIAWFDGKTGNPGLTPPLRYEDEGGNFDFTTSLQGTLSTTELSWRISDHYPMWVSFSVRG